MDPITQQQALAAAGAGGDKVYVDDVFSTFLYDGNNGTQSINNGIDLSGEGGMVWLKRRNSANDHYIGDTVRGAGKILLANETNAQLNWDANDTIKSFDSSGFTVGGNSGFNGSSDEMASWTFRKAPGFFDVVTWTGNGTGQTISHNLGSVPGSIWVKQLNFNRDWWCYHRGTDATNPSHYILNLNTFQARTDHSAFNDTEPTSTSFTLSSAGEVNGNGDTYVAYIFAHDDQSFGDAGNESIIKCGSYTGNGGTQSVNVGFEPQFLITKRTDGNGNWFIHDVMRKFTATGTGEAATLRANASTAEYSNTARIHVNSTGFNFDAESSADVNANGSPYIYIAIRRPHKPPSAGTEVFALDTQNSGSYSSPPYYRSNFVVDTAIRIYIPDLQYVFMASRMTDEKYLLPHSNAAESTNSLFEWDYNNGYGGSVVNSTSTDNISYMFKRAPGFFDVAAYVGDNVAGKTVAHNLGVVPEFIAVKERGNSNDWFVYFSALGADKHIKFNDNNGEFNSTKWNSTSPTSSVFSLSSGGNVNRSGGNFIAFLFATLPGISKVGSYTGTGNSIAIDCGFTAGARFVMIKRTDNSGDWYVFDTTQGIVSGNDPYWRLNSTSAQVTNTDYIDPLGAGFTVTSSAPAALNASGGTYIFLAIA